MLKVIPKSIPENEQKKEKETKCIYESIQVNSGWRWIDSTY